MIETQTFAHGRMCRTTALWSACPALGDVPSSEGGVFGRSGGRAVNLLLDSIFRGAGGVDRSLGPGDHSARRRLVWKI